MRVRAYVLLVLSVLCGLVPHGTEGKKLGDRDFDIELPMNDSPTLEYEVKFPTIGEVRREEKKWTDEGSDSEGGPTSDYEEEEESYYEEVTNVEDEEGSGYDYGHGNEAEEAYHYGEDEAQEAYSSDYEEENYGEEEVSFVAGHDEESHEEHLDGEERLVTPDYEEEDDLGTKNYEEEEFQEEDEEYDEDVEEVDDPVVVVEEKQNVEKVVTVGEVSPEPEEDQTADEEVDSCANDGVCDQGATPDSAAKEDEVLDDGATQDSPESSEDEEEPDNVEIIYTANGQKLRCTIPSEEELEEGEKIKPRPDPVKEALELLEQYRDLRIKRSSEEWWTYLFGFHDEILQFHESTANTKSEYFTLGKYAPDEEADVQEKILTDEQIYTEMYTDGTPCDLTGIPRRTRVRYICHHGRPFIDPVVEVKTCVYELNFSTQLICGHSWYQLSQKKKKVPITCTMDKEDEPFKGFLSKRLLRSTWIYNQH